jgi:uncharacterized protein YbjT (DUF2867 family)
VVEWQLAAAGIPHALVAPTYFYDNALGGVQEIADGMLYLPLPPDHRLQQLDRRDLGRFVALVLSSPAQFAGQRIELASSEPTGPAMAAALARRSGGPSPSVRCQTRWSKAGTRAWPPCRHSSAATGTRWTSAHCTAITPQSAGRRSRTGHGARSTRAERPAGPRPQRAGGQGLPDRPHGLPMACRSAVI